MDTQLLFEHQDVLQQECSEVIGRLNLIELLHTAGDPIQVGSSAMGLLVWRDLDITVSCDKINMDIVAAIGSEFMKKKEVQHIRFRNDTGHWNTDPRYPDGLYLSVTCQIDKGVDWNIDIWFVDEPEKQPDLKHLKALAPRLNKENRTAILTIKTEWATKPEYRKTVTSYDIYDAVLNHEVRTINEFQNWLKTK